MKRIVELRDLSDDHHTALILARRCRQAGRGDADAPPDVVWAQVRETFERHLEPHFEIEERHLLPGLEDIGEVSLARRVREDHDALRTLRDAGCTDAPALARFGKLLEAHVRYEERQVFEPTQHRLPDSVLEAIASACASIPRVCPASLGS